MCMVTDAHTISIRIAFIIFTEVICKSIANFTFNTKITGVVTHSKRAVREEAAMGTACTRISCTGMETNHAAQITAVQAEI